MVYISAAIDAYVSQYLHPRRPHGTGQHTLNMDVSSVIGRTDLEIRLLSPLVDWKTITDSDSNANAKTGSRKLEKKRLYISLRVGVT